MPKKRTEQFTETQPKKKHRRIGWYRKVVLIAKDVAENFSDRIRRLIRPRDYVTFAEIEKAQIQHYVDIESRLIEDPVRCLYELQYLRKLNYVQYHYLHLSPEIAESYFRMFQRTFSDDALQARLREEKLKALQLELAHGLATFSVNGNARARELILALHPMISIERRAQMTTAQRRAIVKKYPSLAIAEISKLFTIGVRNFGKKTFEELKSPKRPQKPMPRSPTIRERSDKTTAPRKGPESET